MLFIVEIIHIFFLVYTLMLLARIVGSWIPELKQYKLMLFINFYTEPYLAFFRKIIPPLGMFDLSPLIAFFALQIMEKIVIGVLL